MDSINKFGKTLDAYVKTNEAIQPEDKNLLTIEYEFLIKLFVECIETEEKKREYANKKLNLIKDVLDL